MIPTAPISRLALGSAQFGMSYGVANLAGKVSIDEVANILQLASDSGIDTIDTAVNYGDSESQLGKVGVGQWRVVSKLPTLGRDAESVLNWVRGEIEGSLQRLNIPSLYGMLLHHPLDLLGVGGEALFNALNLMKQLGLVEKIGVSVYTPAEVERIISRYPIDLVQIPFNIFDRRLVTTGCLKTLKEAGIEVHVRSIFHQGLLVMDPQKRHAFFKRWSDLFNDWDAWLIENKITPLEACLGYALSEPGIDRVVVGVERLTQLHDILLAAKKTMPLPPAYLRSDDPDLINPSFWNV